jgi:hypothetical protein
LLTGLSGPIEGRSFQLEKSVNIGRARDSDVEVLDAGVSRNHARIERAREGLVLADLGSSNGTAVNGRKIRGPVPLLPGDVIRVGRSELSVDIGTIATAPPKERVPTVAPAHVEPTMLLREHNGFMAGEEPAGSPTSRRRLIFRSCLVVLIVVVCMAVALAAGYTMMTRDDNPSPPSQSANDTLVQVRHSRAIDWSGDDWAAAETAARHNPELQPCSPPAHARPLLKSGQAAARAGTNVGRSVLAGNVQSDAVHLPNARLT